MSKLALYGLEAATTCYEGSEEAVHSPNEMEEYNRSKCNLVVAVLKLVEILVDHRHDNADSVCL